MGQEPLPPETELADDQVGHQTPYPVTSCSFTLILVPLVSFVVSPRAVRGRSIRWSSGCKLIGETLHYLFPCAFLRARASVMAPGFMGRRSIRTPMA